MNSHFYFSKKQRSGILLLIIIVVVIQCLYFFIDIPNEKILSDSDSNKDFIAEIDSLKQIVLEQQKLKIYPFNPNYITDYKGYTLGMSNEEIDRLHKFREQGKWVNSSSQFQEVTQVSDTLLNKIAPYFKFPDWVTNPKPKSNSYSKSYNTPKTFEQKLDLNKATAKQLERVNGIGKALSERIIKFRNKFKGGFIADVQLQDVYGLSPEVIERLKNDFTVKTPRQIQKINLNNATIEQLVTIQHIDYELAYEIIDQRTLREGYKSLEELIKVKDFPRDKIEIIKLYLVL